MRGLTAYWARFARIVGVFVKISQARESVPFARQAARYSGELFGPHAAALPQAAAVCVWFWNGEFSLRIELIKNKILFMCSFTLEVFVQQCGSPNWTALRVSLFAKQQVVLSLRSFSLTWSPGRLCLERQRKWNDQNRNRKIFDFPGFFLPPKFGCFCAKQPVHLWIAGQWSVVGQISICWSVNWCVRPWKIYIRPKYNRQTYRKFSAGKNLLETFFNYKLTDFKCQV